MSKPTETSPLIPRETSTRPPYASCSYLLLYLLRLIVCGSCVLVPYLFPSLIMALPLRLDLKTTQYVLAGCLDQVQVMLWPPIKRVLDSVVYFTLLHSTGSQVRLVRKSDTLNPVVSGCVNKLPSIVLTIYLVLANVTGESNLAGILTTTISAMVGVGFIGLVVFIIFKPFAVIVQERKSLRDDDL
jgi:hypothetical protein